MPKVTNNMDDNFDEEVSTPEELSDAIKKGKNRIVITGKLGDKVIRIEAIGPVAWAVAIGAIGVAVAGIIAASTGVGAPAGGAMEFVAMPTLVATMGGAGVVSTAIAIAVAGGGVGVLTSLRQYKAKREDGKVILTKKR